MKSVRIRSYSGPYFPAFGLIRERYGVSLRIQSECEIVRTRITPNMDTFYAVFPFYFAAYHQGSFISEFYIYKEFLLRFKERLNAPSTCSSTICWNKPLTPSMEPAFKILYIGLEPFYFLLILKV